jgi:urease accessory protein
MIFRVTRIAALAAVLIALTGPAFAHTGHSHAGGFVHGFMHPFGGLDHVLVMVAVGLYAARLGGRARWLMPATFVAFMAFGGLLGTFRIADPFFEVGVAMSVVVLGLAVALRVDIPALTAIAVAGLIAIVHGYAHGAGMPGDVPGFAYAAGFMLATALLHGAGIALGVLAAKLADRGGWRVARAGGGATMVAGIAILGGVLERV